MISDLEYIAKLPEVEDGRVRIELNPLGFLLRARKIDLKGKLATVQRIISYEQFEKAKNIRKIVELEIEEMLRSLNEYCN